MKAYAKITIILLIALASCDLIEFHPYETNLNQVSSSLNQHNIDNLLDNTPLNDTLRFAWVSDNHYYYDELDDFVNHINQNKTIDFVLHGGDFTDCSTKKEYTWYYDIMNKLDVPYITIVGNHDLLGTGETLFQYVFGDDNFSFTYKRIRFLCLNNNILESSKSLPDTSYIFSQTRNLTDTSYDHTIVAAHSFLETNKTQVYKSLEGSRDLLFLIQGHKHVFKSQQINTLGVEHITSSSSTKKEYLIFEISGSHYTYYRQNF